MFDCLVIATDGSTSGERAVETALDLAARFDATVHGLYVVDTAEVEASPAAVRESLYEALTDRGERVLDELAARGDGAFTLAVREGRPPAEIGNYAREVDADVVAIGTRGRHGESGYLLGSVAEAVVRTCPVPVLSVRGLPEASSQR